MIQALSLAQSVMRSASWPVPLTITGSEDPLVQKALQAINFVGLALGRRQNWRWLHRQESFTTIPEYLTGTVDLVKGSATVTGTLTAWTDDLKGRVFKARSFVEVYRIRSVESATSLTLESTYNGDDQTEVAYTIAQNHYPLAFDVDTELNLLEFRPSEVQFISPEEMDEIRFGGVAAFRTGNPTHATIRGISGGQLVLELFPFTKEARLLVYSYYAALNKLAEDEDSWPFPESYEAMIHDGALSYIRQNAQDDPRVQLDVERFVEQRSDTASNNRKTDQQTRFIPSTFERRLRSRRGRRLSTARFDLGTAFDT